MIGDKRTGFKQDYHYNQQQETQKTTNQTLTNIIHEQFQKTHIKKLYLNPTWTERAFWVAITAVEDQTETELPEILQAGRKYLEENKLPIPPINWGYWVPNTYSQRDNMKIIRTFIQNTPWTKDQIEQHAAEQGISKGVFQSAIIQMKKEGSVFETKDGILKCI